MLSVFPHATMHRAARRILLVDDDAGLRTSLALLLTADGHRAIEAAGGEEALGLLGQTQVDLVITDLEMAGVSGWDVVRAAKDRSPSLPVILLTGWGDQAATAAPAATDVDAILAKPFQLEAFLRLVAEYARD